MVTANAAYQKQWRERNAMVLKTHRAMLPVISRLMQRESQRFAHELARLLGAAIGKKNCAHLAHYLEHPKEKRPEIDVTKIREALSACRTRTVNSGNT